MTGACRSAPDARVVERLLREQVPDLASARVRPSSTSGSSNWVFRVGEHHAARLPRSDTYADDLRKEARWLPVLAPRLPVPVPDVIHRGEPSESFPRPWTVVTWVPGDAPGVLGSAEQRTLAGELGQFARRLHAVDIGDEAAGSRRWGYRCGEPVTETIDGWLDAMADELSDLFDPHRVRQAWSILRDVPPASNPPCWVHTDLSAENLLVSPDGKLAGVVDFGGLGIGDRSIDLLYAWDLFDASARDLLRAAARVDDATWLRARAWAFVGPGLVTIEGCRDSMPARTQRLVRMVEAVAGEVGVALR